MERQLPSINDDSTVKKYLSLLLNHGNTKEYNETKELLKYIEQIENQYSEIVSELQDVKTLLQNLQNPTTKSRLSQIVEKTEYAINNGLKKINTIKQELMSSMKHSIDNFKMKGKSGIIKTVHILHFKEALASVRKSFFVAMKKTENLSQTCDSISSEARQAKSHLRSIKYLMLGKKSNSNYQDLPTINILQKSVRSIHKSLENMVIKTTHILHKIDNFEKLSVKNEIKSLTHSSQQTKQKQNNLKKAR